MQLSKNLHPPQPVNCTLHMLPTNYAPGPMVGEHKVMPQSIRLSRFLILLCLLDGDMRNSLFHMHSIGGKTVGYARFQIQSAVEDGGGGGDEGDITLPCNTSSTRNSTNEERPCNACISRNVAITIPFEKACNRQMTFKYTQGHHNCCY